METAILKCSGKDYSKKIILKIKLKSSSRSHEHTFQILDQICNTKIPPEVSKRNISHVTLSWKFTDFWFGGK